MRSISEVVGAGVLFVVAVVCWKLGVTPQEFGATPDGEPAFESIRYSGSWISAATVAVLGGSLLLIDAIRTAIVRPSHTG